MTLTDFTDHDLIKALRGLSSAEPAQAWREWNDRHLPRARALATRVLRHSGVATDLADDVLQLASVKFWLHLDDLDPTRPPLPYYLTLVYRHSVSCVREEIRFRKALRRLPSAKRAVPPDAIVAEREEVAQMLAQVSPEDQEMMMAKYFASMSAEEIAAVRKVSPNQVYRGLHRGRTEIRAWAAKRQSRAA